MDGKAPPFQPPPFCGDPRRLAKGDARAGPGLVEALAETSDLRAVAGRAGLALTLAAADELLQLRAAAACADLPIARRRLGALAVHRRRRPGST